MSVDQNVRTAVLKPYTSHALDDESETPAVMFVCLLTLQSISPSLLAWSESAGTPPSNVKKRVIVKVAQQVFITLLYKIFLELLFAQKLIKLRHQT